MQAGKVRALGASAMYGYQFAKLQATAEKNGWTKFVSMQNHYNLIYREDERELIPICKEQNVALTPYSPLAAGRLARLWSSDTFRSKTDEVAKEKYDKAMESDLRSRKGWRNWRRNGRAMAQIALAWLFAKGVASPVVFNESQPPGSCRGKPDIELSADEIAYLEEPYIPHRIVGAL